jgi:ketosteroid isomerase-like protein
MSLILTLPGTTEASEEEAVMAVTQAACDALLRGDIAELRRLLTPDFTLVGSDASIQTREQLLDEVRSGEPQYEVFRNHGMAARIYGDAAVVHGITTLKGLAGGEPFSVDVRFTDTLIRVDGEWRMATSHVTRIPAN